MKMMRYQYCAAALAMLLGAAEAFVNPTINHATTITPTTSTTSMNLMADPTTFLTDVPQAMEGVAALGNSILQDLPSSLQAFTDQGQNLAGIFFQASLLPYLLFLYFLSFRGNQIPALGNFGFQFVLLFVISTIPSGIISKSVYGFSLADTDFLHGSAEMLLTVANILIVGGQ